MPKTININAWLNTLSLTSRTLPIVILYVTEGCNLRCMMCSYREALPDELTLQEIGNIAESLRRYGLEHIVYSGGEPLVRSDFPEICKTFNNLNVQQTLLTNGLLLAKRFSELEPYFSEIIISLDGADERTHNKIRGVQSFGQIIKGIQRVTAQSARVRVSIRTVLQKENFRQLPDIIELAKSLRVHRISFLSADVLSDGFGRDTRGTVASNDQIILAEDEVREFRGLVDRAVEKYRNEFAAGFIGDPPAKLSNIVQYYEAMIGKAPLPRNYCNAPMVSAVITSNGFLQPCFFLPAYGNIRQELLQKLLNSSQIRSTRRAVRDYSLERCQTCVCTLHVRPMPALMNRF